MEKLLALIVTICLLVSTTEPEPKPVADKCWNNPYFTTNYCK